MEADWEVEIAPDAPVIDAAWDGIVDLRGDPRRVCEIAEASNFPALADVLVRLNAPYSPVSTVKCDVWWPDKFDPDEMEAEPGSVRHALAAYIDLIPARVPISATLESQVDWCKRLCVHLRSKALHQCRADMIVRRAFVTAEVEGIGVTVYVTGCGSCEKDALGAWSYGLSALADSALAIGGAGALASKYNQNIVGE